MTDELGSRRRGVIGGIGGAVIGGFTWVVIAGVLIGDARVWSAAIVAAALVGWSTWRVYRRDPGNLLLVVGWAALLVGLLDLGFLAWVLPRLPAERASLWLGYDRSFAIVRPLAVIGSVSGALVMLWALWKGRRRSV